MNSKSVPAWASGLIGIGALGFFLWLEFRRPLRRSVESKLVRDARNLALGGIGAVTVQLAELPVTAFLSTQVERRNWGLLKFSDAPQWVEVIAAVLLLDYTLYVWHVLTHKVPFLWRFHVVHHVDLDLDSTTALRFHFAELVASVPWRAAQILLIGVTPLSLTVWQTALFVSILFHHSNARLPVQLERALNWVIVTPRMHGIHHSVKHDQTDSNWSSGLSVWDRLHGTLRQDGQSDITIGVPAFQDPSELTFSKLLTMPFGKQRPSWREGNE